MLSTLINNVREEAKHTAGTAAISIGASIAIGVGLAFWTGAGWFFLLTLTSPMNAAMIIGALYTGTGLIGFAIASMRGRKKLVRQKQVPQAAPTFDNFVAAFMTGVSAGSRTRS